MATQEIFEHCYRNRQRAIHHMAYMRMGKVLLALELLQSEAIDLNAKQIFDYGFGAGTFFRFCPRDAHLFGVEMDPENVAEVAAMLRGRGYHHVDLQAIDISTWEAHPLLARQYDVIQCSHVLEHMENPVSLVRRLAGALRPGGVLVALVPINERAQNVHHVTQVDEAMIDGWAGECGLEKLRYVERDPWFYWPQFLFAAEDTPWRHKVAQAISITTGIPATLSGPRRWRQISEVFARLTCSKPTQAGVVLQKPH